MESENTNVFTFNFTWNQRIEMLYIEIYMESEIFYIEMYREFFTLKRT